MPMTLTPQLQISERYLETIFQNTDTRSEDYVSSAIATLRADYHPVLFHFEGDYSLGPTFYSRDSSQNNINQQGSFTFSAERPRGSASVNGSVVSTKFPDLISQYNEGIIVHGSQYLQEGVGFQSNYLWTRRSSFSFSYTYLKNDYNAEQLNNSETQTAGLSMTYDKNEFNRFILSGAASYYRYQTTGDSRSVSARAQWNHQWGRYTSIQAGTGAGEASGHYLYWLGDITVTRKYEKGTIQAGYSRNLSAGGGLNGSTVVTQQGTLNLSRTYGENLSGNISGSYGESFAFQPLIDYHSRFWNGAIVLTYSLFKWLNSSLSFSHYDQRLMGRTSEELQSNQIILTLSSNFSAWRPFK